MRPDAILSTDQRRLEIARIFAKAILRLQARLPLAPVPNAENPTNSTPDCLDVSPQLRLTVHTS